MPHRRKPGERPKTKAGSEYSGWSDWREDGRASADDETTRDNHDAQSDVSSQQKRYAHTRCSLRWRGRNVRFPRFFTSSGDPKTFTIRIVPWQSCTHIISSQFIWNIYAKSLYRCRQLPYRVRGTSAQQFMFESSVVATANSF